MQIRTAVLIANSEPKVIADPVILISADKAPEPAASGGQADVSRRRADHEGGSRIDRRQRQTGSIAAAT
jgi:hypothetical protein